MMNILSVKATSVQGTFNGTETRTYKDFAEAMADFDGGIIRIEELRSDLADNFQINRDTVLDLCGQTVSGLRMRVEGGAELYVKNGTLLTRSMGTIINVSNGTATLDDCVLSGRVNGGPNAGLVNVQPLATNAELEAIAKGEVEKIKSNLRIKKDAKLYALGNSSCAVGCCSLRANAYNNSTRTTFCNQVSAFIQNPVIDVEGEIYCEGWIALYEWGSDYFGSEVNIYEGAFLSSCSESIISKINGGSLNLYGGTLYAQTPICMRYNNTLNVPATSTVEVYAFGENAGNYYEIGSSAWDNSEHLCQTGCAIAIDRNYRTQRNPGTLNIAGGRFYSDNNVAVGSFDYRGTYERALGFAAKPGSGSNPPKYYSFQKSDPSYSNVNGAHPYDTTTGAYADYGIYRS